jgi:hypothetical protein
MIIQPQITRIPEGTKVVCAQCDFFNPLLDAYCDHTDNVDTSSCPFLELDREDRYGTARIYIDIIT